MTLWELKKAVEIAIEKAYEFGENPNEILVSVQIDTVTDSGDFESSLFSYTNVEVCYDGNATASGCVIFGITK